MMAAFVQKVLRIIERLSHPYSDLTQDTFCANLRGPGAVQARSVHALTTISRELQRVYKKPVVVLIDEYDAPMHSALEHNYSASVCFILLLYCNYLMLFQASEFFAGVFSSLLKVCQCQ
jgi:hypothetical protein